MAVWVLKKPLQHIPMAVKTATSLPLIHPLAINGGTSDMAAPTAPSEVAGKATSSGCWKPNSRSNSQPTLGGQHRQQGNPLKCFAGITLIARAKGEQHHEGADDQHSRDHRHPQLHAGFAAIEQ